MNPKENEYIDSLTGLYDRRYFDERLSEQKSEADRFRSGAFGLVIVDLDRFRFLNVSRGPTTGDAVLIQAARLLKSNLKSSDIVCRYGGDEFAVILPGVKKEHVARIAERIVGRYPAESWLDAEGKPIDPVTCSAGYGVYLAKGTDLEEFTKLVEDCLSCAKRKGGAQACGE